MAYTFANELLFFLDFLLQQELQAVKGGSGDTDNKTEEEEGTGSAAPSSTTQSQAMLALNMQLQSTAMKAHAKVVWSFEFASMLEQSQLSAGLCS